MDVFDDDKLQDMMTGVDDDQKFKIKERVPYADEPETREHEADDPVEAAEIIGQIESPEVASSVVDVDFMD